MAHRLFGFTWHGEDILVLSAVTQDLAHPALSHLLASIGAGARLVPRHHEFPQFGALDFWLLLQSLRFIRRDRLRWLPPLRTAIRIRVALRQMLRSLPKNGCPPELTEFDQEWMADFPVTPPIRLTPARRRIVYDHKPRSV